MTSRIAHASDLRPPFREPMDPVLVAGWHSATIPSVADILDSVAQLQVIGSNARRVITLVENPKAVRDRAVVEFPRQATSDNVAVVSSTSPHLSISLPVHMGSPYPAWPKIGQHRAVLIDLGPKPILDRLSPSGARAFVRAASIHTNKYTN